MENSDNIKSGTETEVNSSESASIISSDERKDNDIPGEVKDEDSPKDPASEKEEPQSSRENKEDEWLDILGSGQLKKKVIRPATNSYRPQNLHICEVNLECCLQDGTVVDKFDRIKIQIGEAEVVQGLDLALPLMDVGEEALVEVGPRFGYGNLGRAPEVPPNATLLYKVEILSAEPEPDLEKLLINERKAIGNRKRERGNWWYSRQDYTFAIQCYRRALEFLDDIEGGITYETQERQKPTDEELHDLLKDRLKVYNNLAAAQMKIKAFDTALQSVENVLRCEPQNVKALFRKGKILAAKGENSSAVTVLRNASQLEPESKTIRQELQRLLTLHKEDAKLEKSLYKKMLGQDKRTETGASRPSSFQQFPWGVLLGSVAAVVVGMVAYRYKFL